MQQQKFTERKFVSVDPSKCTGCGICEYACTLEKGEAVSNPLRSRIRTVRMMPVFNFALACRFCEDAACVKACPEEALEIVASDEAAEKRFSDAMDKLPAETERLTEAVRKKDFKQMLADAEKRGMKVNEKLEALNKKARAKKQP